VVCSVQIDKSHADGRMFDYWIPSFWWYFQILLPSHPQMFWRKYFNTFWGGWVNGGSLVRLSVFTLVSYPIFDTFVWNQTIENKDPCCVSFKTFHDSCIYSNSLEKKTKSRQNHYLTSQYDNVHNVAILCHHHQGWRSHSAQNWAKFFCKIELFLFALSWQIGS